jgi:tRNA(Glu) U13 pseudouridine synthase TruD
VTALKKLSPDGVRFNGYFEKIYEKGTGKQFKIEHNRSWLLHTRPLMEAFYHARSFLEAAIASGKGCQAELSFMLLRGSYATVILREIMKPSNPITAGF